MRVQQYSTPDGSIWEETNEDDHYLFRVDSLDGSHEDDAHGQHLSKVIRHWGALSLHDPVKEQTKVLTKALKLTGYNEGYAWSTASNTVEELDKMGYEIRKKDD